MGNKTFEEQALELRGYLHGFALKLAQNEEDAEDILQEAYLRIFKHKVQFNPGTNVKAWSSRIVLNIFINSYRKNVKNKDKIRPRMIPLSAFGDFSRTTPDALIIAAEQETDLYNFNLQQDIDQAIADLPDSFRHAAEGKFHDDLDYETIGRKIGVPEGTVKSKIHRARKQLQAKLRKYKRTYGLKSGEIDNG